MRRLNKETGQIETDRNQPITRSQVVQFVGRGGRATGVVKTQGRTFVNLVTPSGRVMTRRVTDPEPTRASAQSLHDLVEKSS